MILRKYYVTMTLCKYYVIVEILLETFIEKEDSRLHSDSLRIFQSSFSEIFT